MCKGEGKSLAEGEGDEAGEHGKSKGKGSKADGSMLWQGLLDDVRRMPQLWMIRIGPGAEVHATRAGQASRGSGGGRGALAGADGDLPMAVAGQAGAADVTAAEDDEDWGQDRPAQSYSSRGEGFKADGKGKSKAEGDDKGLEQHVNDLNAACGSEAIALAAQNCNESCEQWQQQQLPAWQQQQQQLSRFISNRRAEGQGLTAAEIDLPLPL